MRSVTGSHEVGALADSAASGVVDITYFRTGEGWLYLAGVADVLWPGDAAVGREDRGVA
jgi:hypothetical protein